MSLVGTRCDASHRARALTNDTVRATRSRDDEDAWGEQDRATGVVVVDGGVGDARTRLVEEDCSREVVNGDDGPTGAESVA